MNFAKVYDKMPISTQNMLISLYGYKLIRERYGKYYKKEIEFLRENFYTLDHENFQKENLKVFLSNAVQKSEYFNQSRDLNDSIDLSSFPILTKEDIRKNIDKMLTEDKKNMISSFTGGTTGKSLNIYFTKEDMQKRMAFLDFFKERHGVKKGMRRASFTGKNLVPVKQKSKHFTRVNKSLNQLLISSFHLTEENIPYYLKDLNDFKPESMDGFPSVMVELAKYIIRNNIQLEFSPIAIFPTAETLIEHDKELLEKAFNTKVRNQYASSEGAPFITECEKGNLHLDLMTGVFEKIEHTNISEILVTSFSSNGTPLIRYQIGDSLEFTDEKCTCIYKTPIVRKIMGRSMDYLLSEERGKISSANMSNTIKKLPNSVKNIQFIQEKKEEILISLVIDSKLYKDNHTDEILNEMQVRLGKSMKFRIEIVDQIPLEKSGKYRMVKNKMV